MERIFSLGYVASDPLGFDDKKYFTINAWWKNSKKIYLDVWVPALCYVYMYLEFITKVHVRYTPMRRNTST